jgi:hypothetical protein
MPVKTKLTLSIDRSVVQRGKKSAARSHVSLSRVVADMLERETTTEEPLFADYWYGRFSHVKDPDAERRRYLGKRYG